MSSIGKLMKQAARMQQQMEQVQSQLAQRTVEATSGGGAVKVVAKCDGSLGSVKIDPQALNPDDAQLLEDMISKARVIDQSRIDTSKVQILNKVKMKNLMNNQEMEYLLVSETEADLKAGKIAVNSPIAKGLLGRKVGDVVEIKVPSGLIKFEIVNISR